jgi:lipoate-protein ligase A
VGLEGEDFITAMRMALEKAAYPKEMGINVEDANSVYPVNLPEGKTMKDVLADASVMLLPYCAKLPECKFRFTQGCTECGMCTIGDAYKLAREKNIDAVTIVKFEHLQATLSDMKKRGVKSYIGMCCEEFYIKRQKAFADAGIPGVLMDIDGRTCYELQEEKEAYSGTFEALADLKPQLVESVMKFVPPANGNKQQ